MKKLTFALAALLAFAAPAAAQPEPTPGQLQAAREFVEVSRLREMLPRTMEAMLQSGLLEGEEEDGLPEGFADTMLRFFEEHLSYDDMEAGFIRIYAELFTEQELRDLVAFYRTPTGQRMVELTPELSARTQALTSQLMEAAMPELMEMMMQMVEEEMDAEEMEEDEEPPRS